MKMADKYSMGTNYGVYLDDRIVPLVGHRTTIGVAVQFPV